MTSTSRFAPKNAERIYEQTKADIGRLPVTPRRCMEMSHVELVCTTEDPIDDPAFHRRLSGDSSLKTRVIPAMRPDKAMCCEAPAFGGYLLRLETAAGMNIQRFSDLISALKKRLLLFKEIGCVISDSDLESFVWADADEAELNGILDKARRGEKLTERETSQFHSAFLLHMGRIYKQNGFVMQLRIGALRNVNSRMFSTLGPDTGYDCTDSASSIRDVSRLLDRLNAEENLPKTILYPLNPCDIEPYAILAASFCRGPVRGHVQLGAPWWFNDQPYGIERQFEAVSSLYPLGLSVGMLTDSRSFLSYPRHELYRRILCSYIGKLIDRGEYFSDEQQLKSVIENVCYYNAKNYFGL